MTKMAVTPSDHSIHRISKKQKQWYRLYTTHKQFPLVQRLIVVCIGKWRHLAITYENKKLSHCRGTAVQGALVLAKSGRMGLALADDIL